MYSFVDEYCLNDDESCYGLGYSIDGDEKDVGIEINDVIYYFPNEEAAQLHGITANRWYIMNIEETISFTPYNGSSPIDLNTFQQGTVKDSTYLQRVIDSFGN